MKKLYAPWRSYYTQTVNQKKEDTQTCVFCTILTSLHDSENFVVQRLKYNAVLLNKYPYNPGHLLIVPYIHVPKLHALDAPARTEMMESCAYLTQLLQPVFDNQGWNIGMNIGKAAGAGIPDHIHMHLLPRFFGDTNFLPTLANTKQISFDLAEIYATVISKLR